MAVGDDVRGLDSDLFISKIPKPRPSSTPRARTPPRLQPSAAPSRIPQSSAAARCRRQHSLEAHSASASIGVPQRTVTPAPSSDLDGRDIITRLKMRRAQRLQQNFQDPYASASVSEIPIMRQRVEPGSTMTAPSVLSTNVASTRSSSARRNSTPTGSSMAATAEVANSRRTSVACAQGLRRTRSAGTFPIQRSTPRSVPGASKPADCQGSSTETCRPVQKSAGGPAPSTVLRRKTPPPLRRKTPPPSTRVSAPLCCSSGGKTFSELASLAPSCCVIEETKAREETVTAPVLEQILQENRALRDAFKGATDRIAALEDGQSRFFHEGIFDLVNAVHSDRPMQTFLPAADVELY